MEYKDLETILNTIKENKLTLLTGSTRDCGVCIAVKPRIEKILDKYSHVKNVYVYVDDLEAAAGEFMIFTVPTIILFAEGKEVHRESRIIDFQQLEFELARWSEFLENTDSE